MMRPATAMGFFKETAVKTYESTPLSEALTTPALYGGYQFMFVSSPIVPDYKLTFLAGSIAPIGH